MDEAEKSKKISIRCTAQTRSGFRCKNRVIIVDEKGESSGNCICHIHQLQARRKEEKRKQIPIVVFEKPENCPVCFEKLPARMSPLICGHWVHQKCVEKHFKAECPVCRCFLPGVTVYGKPPVEDPSLLDGAILPPELRPQLTYIDSYDTDDLLAAILESSRAAAEFLLNSPESPLYAIPIRRSIHTTD